MYDHKVIEPKWQARWAEAKTFEPDLKTAPNPFYNLMMFPYPSGEGLHVGHAYAFGGADAFGRFKRLQGHTVFEPMGFDAFGIHAENFAIKKGMHPRELIALTTAHYREEQMKPYGGMWDWSRQLNTTDPAYYRWTQWIFVQFFKAGLAERKKQALNWCPSCKTVLADEQVELKEEKNVCERCKTVVERKLTEQWFFRITDYAERLLDYHGTQWSKTTRQLQTNWIGRSAGAKVRFSLAGPPEREIEVYTTRPDTLFGATFFVLAPEHAAVSGIIQVVTPEKKAEIETYLDLVAHKTGVDRAAAKDKTGVDTGLQVINPVNGKKIPVFIADYVLTEYGTGAVMGVPAHDQRDWEFARKHHLEIVPVLKGAEKHDYTQRAWDGEGILINSGPWNGWQVPGETDRVTNWLEKKSLGTASLQYKLRDWCLSRQRYWGPPIPMIYCENCAQKGDSWFTGHEGRKAARRQDKKERFAEFAPKMAGWYPVAEADLPVELPFVADYQPRGEGKSPLAMVPDFSRVPCPSCGAAAARETDVSDTFLDSAWYFLRYPSVGDNTQPFDPALTKKWLPVEMYIGGNEHACLHLLYSRFVTMALHDLGYLEFEEPFRRFYAHGLIIKDGAKMSKSRGNVINPEEYVEKFGADALRMYLLFLGPLPQGGDFQDTGMQGMVRFLRRLYRLSVQGVVNEGEMGFGLCLSLHRTIKKVGSDYSRLKFNTAIAAIMELVNVWQAEPEAANRELVGTVARLLAPIAPHLSEEFWELAGGKLSVLDAGWPEYNEGLLIKDEITIAVQINGKTRGQIRLATPVAVMKTELDQEKVVMAVRQDSKLSRYLAEKEIIRTVYVPSRLVNLIVSQKN